MIYIPFMVAIIIMRTIINDFGSQQELYVDTACVTRVSVLIHCNIFVNGRPDVKSTRGGNIQILKFAEKQTILIN